MAKTTTARLGLTQWSAATDAPLRTDFNTSFAQIEALVPLDGQGVAFPATPVQGQWFLRTDTATQYRWDGTQWRYVSASVPPGPWTAYTPTLSNATLGNGTVVGRYRVLDGKTVTFVARFLLGTTSTLTAGSFGISLPVTSAAGTGAPEGLVTATCYKSSTNTLYLAGGGIGATSTTVSPYVHASTGINNTNPFTWGSGDVFDIASTYETA